MKIALAQFNPTVGDFSGNTARILELASQAKQRGADLAVFSELCVCGYLPLDLLERPIFVERNQREVECLARKTPLPILIGYARDANGATGKRVYNDAALLANGEILFDPHKMFLPTYAVFDESRYFEPATHQQVYVLGRERLGITICEDIWNDKNFWAKSFYDRDPVAELIKQGATIIVNISASPYTLDKRCLRQNMLRSLACSHGYPVVYVNQFGGNDSLVFDGSSLALTAGGRIAAQARSFAEDVVLFDTETGTGDIHPQPDDEMTFALEALVCGTRDYVRKCGFKEGLVGLSGGIASAVVASIAAAAVGKENVTGVSMPGPYSSEGSVRDARRVAQNLGIKFVILPIKDTFA